MLADLRRVHFGVFEMAASQVLFVDPGNDPQGSLGTQMQLLHQLRGFHGYRNAGRVIDGAGSQIPGVEVAGNDHHLLRMLRPFQVSHYVEGADFFRSLRSQNDVHAHLPLRRQVGDQVGIFAGYCSGGNGGDTSSAGMRQTIVSPSD